MKPTTRRIAPLCAAATVAHLFLAPVAGQEPPPGFSEQLTVTEVELIVALPEGAAAREDRLLVREGGQPRPIARLQPIARGDWHLLVYVDVPLSDHATAVAATRALGEEAATLVGLGDVRIVVADPAPKEILPADRDATRVRDALQRVASEPMGVHELVRLRAGLGNLLRKSAEPDTEVAQRAAAEEVATVERQVDRLLTVVADGCPARPCALLLVSNGFDERPDLFYGASLGRSPDPRLDLSVVAQGLARAAAGYGWTVVALPLLEAASVPPEPEALSDFDRQQEDAILPGEERKLARMRIPPRASAWASLQALEVLLLPMTAPLVETAEASGGSVVRTAPRLGPVLAQLGRRTRVWYRTSGREAGEPIAVTVELIGAPGKLRAPGWVLAGTPENVRAARARERSE